MIAVFGYDTLGRRTSLTRRNGTVTGYAYGTDTRLSQLTQDLGGTPNDLVRGFTYNPAGQIVASSKAGGSAD